MSTALILSAIIACTSPDPAVSPDGFGQAVGNLGETNGTGVAVLICGSPDSAVSPDGFGQAVGERGETNGTGFGTLDHRESNRERRQDNNNG